ncbi:MAG: WYL domain-containing protein [Luteitalea sp.]|nr:WYL domain-containing protein [Luteitalea sp.]
MKAERLLASLLLLQAYGKLASRELAERLEVSRRTVHRDMEALSAAGVPVFAMRGAQGGWQLDETWCTRVPGLDEAELRAFLMAQPRVIGDPRLAASAERAVTKLVAALPVSLREQATSIRQRLYVDTTGWRGTTENLSALAVVQDAVSRDRMLTIRYGKLGGVHTERTIAPLGLVAKGTTWYLVANTANGFRTYRVSRIEQATLIDTTFERPPDFDLAAYWRSSTEEFQNRRRYVTTLRLEPSAADSVRMWYRVLPVQSDDHPDVDGWVTLSVDFDNESDACFVVLGLGTRVEVVEPASLRNRVAAEVTRSFERLSNRRGRRRSWGTAGSTIVE